MRGRQDRETLRPLSSDVYIFAGDETYCHDEYYKCTCLSKTSVRGETLPDSTLQNMRFSLEYIEQDYYVKDPKILD